MKLNGLHLLLTYQCTFECDHCFVWGSPWQQGTMRLQDVSLILKQAQALGTIEWIYFEGGEPFLYYATLVRGVRLASQSGFQVGLVSNAYWANSLDDALGWLEPFPGLIQDLSISSDLYHGSESAGEQVRYATQAAEQLGIPVGSIQVAQPEATNASASQGQLPLGESAVMFRGRAAEVLSPRVYGLPWTQFTTCPYEDLREPGRVHVDPFGHLHICQGISLGNLFQTPLKAICEDYQPESHPITGPLLQGGPAELVRSYGLSHAEGYADACHLCYDARRVLRGRFPDTLTPNQVYGEY